MQEQPRKIHKGTCAAALSWHWTDLFHGSGLTYVLRKKEILCHYNHLLLLLLLLSRFSRVRLCATPQPAAHQAPPSLGFSRQEHWSGLPFPCMQGKSESEVAQSCPMYLNTQPDKRNYSVHNHAECQLLRYYIQLILTQRVLIVIVHQS